MRENLVYPQSKPELVAHMDRPGLPGLLDRDSTWANRHRLLVGGRRKASFTGDRRRLKRWTALEQAREGRGGTGERELAGLGRFELTH